MRRVQSIQWIVIAACMAALPVGLLGQRDWPSYGNDPGGMRYSPLTQVTPANVSTVHRAWTYETGEVASSYQVTPLVVENVMYLSTPAQRIVALDAETGEELWMHSRGGAAHQAPSLRDSLATGRGRPSRFR